MSSDKKLQRPVTELFIRGRKLNISLVFISQSYFAVPKDIRLNTTHTILQSKCRKGTYGYIQTQTKGEGGGYS